MESTSSKLNSSEQFQLPERPALSVRESKTAKNPAPLGPTRTDDSAGAGMLDPETTTPNVTCASSGEYSAALVPLLMLNVSVTSEYDAVSFTVTRKEEARDEDVLLKVVAVGLTLRSLEISTVPSVVDMK